MPFKDTAARKAYGREHYLKNRDKRLRYAALQRENDKLNGTPNRRRWEYGQRKRLKDFIASFKQGPCQDCQRVYPSYVMDFDHRDGETKLFVLGRARVVKASFAEIEAEIAKCDVVCSNCHRERTYGKKKEF